jgi:cytochrome b561
MTMSAVAARRAYSRVAVFFHWLTAILVLATFLVSVGGSETRVYSPGNSFSLGLHELLGLSVLATTLLRLLVRVLDPPPPAVAMPAWMHAASELARWGLFTLLMLTPITAIWGAWAEGHAIAPLGLGALAPMIAEAHPLGATLADIHGLLGDAIMWIAGLHATAALFHHFWLRDAVLTAMVPWLKAR